MFGREPPSARGLCGTYMQTAAQQRTNKKTRIHLHSASMRRLDCTATMSDDYESHICDFPANTLPMKCGDAVYSINT